MYVPLGLKRSLHCLKSLLRSTHKDTVEAESASLLSSLTQFFSYRTATSYHNHIPRCHKLQMHMEPKFPSLGLNPLHFRKFYILVMNYADSHHN